MPPSLTEKDATEHEAWLAARDLVMEHRLELNEWRAHDLAQRTLAWTAEEHGR